MADFVDHVDQAKHNLECAKSFLTNRKTRDWAITAAFYSAIHFVEAGFTTLSNIRHSELSAPDDMSHHTFRQEQVRREFPNCYKSYRKLREASQNVRYLISNSSKTGISIDYYSEEMASKFVNEFVEMVRKEVEGSCGINLS